MDLTFSCPKCNQELAVDAAAAGSEISCPTCHHKITIPTPTLSNIHPMNPISSSAAAKEEHHFKVPVREGPSESLIEKPLPTLEVAKEGDKTLRIRCIKRTDCIEVGKDKFEQVVSDFLGKIGEENLVSIHPIVYNHIDMGTRQILTDFGVMIIFKG
jgi:DNA-directed RNA polymerase subunit RPC12/RpoP